MRSRDAIELPEQFPLLLEVLDDGLDDEIAIAQVVEICGPADFGTGLGALLLRQLAALDAACHGALDVL